MENKRKNSEYFLGLSSKHQPKRINSECQRIPILLISASIFAYKVIFLSVIMHLSVIVRTNFNESNIIKHISTDFQI